jgi:hypothetical protein
MEKEFNPKGGRPPYDENLRRKHKITIRVNAKEKEKIYGEVAFNGYKYPLIYCRKKLLSDGSGPGPNPAILFHTMNKIAPELKKIGQNINTVAKYVNYLDKNGMVDQRLIADYNIHWKEYYKVLDEYSKAIRAYLRTVSQ